MGELRRPAHSRVGASKTISTSRVPSASRSINVRSAESTSWITPAVCPYVHVRSTGGRSRFQGSDGCPIGHADVAVGHGRCARAGEGVGACPRRARRPGDGPGWASSLSKGVRAWVPRGCPHGDALGMCTALDGDGDGDARRPEPKMCLPRTPRQFYADRVTDPIVSLDADRLSVEPGGQVSVTIKITNPGTIVEGYRIEVVGDGVSGWGEALPPEISVYPKQDSTAVVVFSPPGGTGAPGGTWPFGIRVRSTEDADASAVAEGDLEIGKVFGLQAKLVPVNSAGRWRGRHVIELSNWGNSPARLKLSATNPDEALAFMIRPDLVELPLGGTATAMVWVRTKKPFLRGSPVRIPFSVVGEPDGAAPQQGPALPYGGTPDRPSVDGALNQKPIISQGAVTIAVLALLAVAGGVAWALTRPPPAQATFQELGPPDPPSGVKVEPMGSGSVRVAVGTGAERREVHRGRGAAGRLPAQLRRRRPHRTMRRRSATSRPRRASASRSARSAATCRDRSPIRHAGRPRTRSRPPARRRPAPRPPRRRPARPAIRSGRRSQASSGGSDVAPAAAPARRGTDDLGRREPVRLRRRPVRPPGATPSVPTPRQIPASRASTSPSPTGPPTARSTTRPSSSPSCARSTNAAAWPRTRSTPVSASRSSGRAGCSTSVRSTPWRTRTRPAARSGRSTQTAWRRSSSPDRPIDQRVRWSVGPVIGRSRRSVGPGDHWARVISRPG